VPAHTYRAVKPIIVKHVVRGGAIAATCKSAQRAVRAAPPWVAFAVSSTFRTAPSRTLCAYLFVAVLIRAPHFRVQEPPANTARFILAGYKTGTGPAKQMTLLWNGINQGYTSAGSCGLPCVSGACGGRFGDWQGNAQVQGG